MDIHFPLLESAPSDLIIEMGVWLDENMPNTPLPEKQRWEIGHPPDSRVGIRFENEHDATHFMIRWA